MTGRLGGGRRGVRGAGEGRSRVSGRGGRRGGGRRAGAAAARARGRARGREGSAGAGQRDVREAWTGAGGCGRAGAGAWRGRVRAARDPGRGVCSTARECSAGSGRATRTGRASPAARALQNRLIIGPWPHIILGVVGRGRHVRDLPWCPPRGARNDPGGSWVGVLHQLRFLHKTRSNSIAQNSIRSSSLPRPVPVPSIAVRVYADEFCACLSLLSLVSQSPVNPPAAIFRRHGGLPEGGSSWRPTVGGGQCPTRTPRLRPS